MMFGMHNAPLASKPSLGLYLILSTVGFGNGGGINV